ncbi:hypothetical protein J504_1215 [Acinetobacter baumannii 348935]|nr:hypothetical protein J504_1215 [Acinetobacter baumannii 348935]
MYIQVGLLTAIKEFYDISKEQKCESVLVVILSFLADFYLF